MLEEEEEEEEEGKGEKEEEEDGKEREEELHGVVLHTISVYLGGLVMGGASRA